MMWLIMRQTKGVNLFIRSFTAEHRTRPSPMHAAKLVCLVMNSCDSRFETKQCEHARIAAATHIAAVYGRKASELNKSERARLVSTSSKVVSDHPATRRVNNYKCR